MAKVDTSRDADIRVYTGSSGSGKSVSVKRDLRQGKYSRVAVWDPDDEYNLPGFRRITSAQELVDLFSRYPKGALKVRFVAEGVAKFNMFCLAAFGWCPDLVICEETADVTTPSKAPPGYGKLLRRGRKRGISVWGVTQRPAESDKTIMGQATRIRCGYMKRAADRDYMARELGVPLDTVNSLVKLQFLTSTETPQGVQVVKTNISFAGKTVREQTLPA